MTIKIPEVFAGTCLVCLLAGCNPCNLKSQSGVGKSTNEDSFGVDFSRMANANRCLPVTVRIQNTSEKYFRSPVLGLQIVRVNSDGEDLVPRGPVMVDDTDITTISVQEKFFTYAIYPMHLVFADQMKSVDDFVLSQYEVPWSFSTLRIVYKVRRADGTLGEETQLIVHDRKR